MFNTSRSKERIPIILDRLRRIWEKYPVLRLAQLIENVFPNRSIQLMCSTDLVILRKDQLPKNRSAYYLEDDEFISELEKFYKVLSKE